MHRVGQFVAHIRARVSPGEEAFAASLLPAGATRLFAAMPVADRRHGLEVARTAARCRLRRSRAALRGAAARRRQGSPHAALAPGRGRPHPGRRLRACWRAWRPQDPASAGYPFHLYLEHGPLSADAALAAGCSPRTAAFIRGSASEADAPLVGGAPRGRPSELKPMPLQADRHRPGAGVPPPAARLRGSAPAAAAPDRVAPARHPDRPAGRGGGRLRRAPGHARRWTPPTSPSSSRSLPS